MKFLTKNSSRGPAGIFRQTFHSLSGKEKHTEHILNEKNVYGLGGARTPAFWIDGRLCSPRAHA